MQTINTQFFKFLNSIFNISEIKLSVYDQFNQYFNMLRNYEHIPIDFDSTISNYPIYPNNYKYYNSLQITPTDSFSSQKIISTALPNSEYLNKSNVALNLTTLNTKIEKMPKKINDINFSHLTQKLFINNDYFNNYMLTLRQNEVYENDYIFYDLLFTEGTDCDSSYDQLNLIQLLTVYYSAYSTYTNCYSIKDSLFLYFYELDSTEQPITISNLCSSFDTFLTTVATVEDPVYIDLTKFILKNNFDMIMPVDDIVNSVKNYMITTQLPDLTTTFTTFLNDNYSNLLKLFFSSAFNKCDNFIFHEAFKKLVDTLSVNRLLNISEESPLKTDLSDKLCSGYVDTLLQGLNTYDLQKYLLPIFLSSSAPIKFINIIPQFIKEFITDNFLTVDQYEDIFIEPEVFSVVSNTSDVINRSELNDFFSSLDVNEIYETSSLGGLTSSLFITDIFQQFTDSDSFNTFIISMLSGINDHLYSERLIPYTQNWYTCIELTKSFFKSFFMTYINHQTDTTYTNHIFPALQIHLDNYFTENTVVYSGSSETVDRILTQQINNTKLTTDIYNLTKNVFYGHLNKTIYNKILTFYLNT